MRENLFLYFEILSCPFQFSPFEERCDKETGECNVEDVNESVDETEGNGDSNVKVVNDIEGEIARVGNIETERNDKGVAHVYGDEIRADDDTDIQGGNESWQDKNIESAEVS